MTAIYKREVKSYFDSMTGYVFIAFMALFTGIYFFAYNLNGGYPYFSFTLSALLTILAFGVPVLTMRSFADERRSRTDQMLLTAPVGVWEIVIGKYLSMVTVLAVPTILCLFCPLIIKMAGNGFLMADYTAILMFFLAGCVFIAIGMFISSLTESQVIAAVGTFGAMILIILWPSLTGMMPSGIGTILANLDIMTMFDNVTSNHILDVSGIILYLSLAGLFFFFTRQSSEKRRLS